ncbi:cupin domain-containing protein [Kordiimonas marina]|uniref:cupin domain-containing protein n=1 Tax=Kordiimonas marina TaxID=2872312 RepID=UPI001FF6355F|nr:cupin domain-containing protein [Kordiimonas marina]MCJ9428356.1 cupin domain-containing protein [Kordiimonas marina]
MRTFLIAMAAAAALTGAASAGEAHKLLETDKTVIGGPITYPSGPAQITAVTVTIDPGEENGWHLHPVPTFGYIETGVLTVYYKGGEKRVFRAGEAVVEAQNVIHKGRNEGTEPVTMRVFYAGATGVPTTVMKQDYKGGD